MNHQQTSSQVTHEIIGAAIEVHRHLGPGLLESAYQACMAYELGARGIFMSGKSQFRSSMAMSD